MLGHRRSGQSDITSQLKDKGPGIILWFNPAILGPLFDPEAGQPVMAGQGVPLAGFPEGDYRLLIRIMDRISRRSLEREVAFTVQS